MTNEPTIVHQLCMFRTADLISACHCTLLNMAHIQCAKLKSSDGASSHPSVPHCSGIECASHADLLAHWQCSLHWLTCDAGSLSIWRQHECLLTVRRAHAVWEEQAISRAHRMGQKGPIKVMRYICKGARRCLHHVMHDHVPD